MNEWDGGRWVGGDGGDDVQVGGRLATRRAGASPGTGRVEAMMMVCDDDRPDDDVL